MTENPRRTKHSSPDRKEIDSHFGILIVITGRSGAGKDAVMAKLLEHPKFQELEINRAITCTDRVRRDNEPEDAYHFHTREEMEKMAEEDELVEVLTTTGTSRKATSKKEIARLLNGESLIWRIDPSRASHVAKGIFFEEKFPEHATTLNEHKLVICIHAPTESIESRRKEREGANYNPSEFETRDIQELPHIEVLLKESCVVQNLDGKLEETVEAALELIVSHHAKIKNKRK